MGEKFKKLIRYINLLGGLSLIFVGTLLIVLSFELKSYLEDINL